MQNYPHFSEAEQEQFKPPNHFPEGYQPRGENCLLYCEKVRDRAMPYQKRLRYTGNLSEPGPHGAGGFDGSFIVDHRLFMEIHLLPLLKELCVAMQVIPLLPETGTKPDKKDIFRPRFAMGGEPALQEDKNKLPDSHVNRGNPKDAYFNFGLVENGKTRDGKQKYKYEWKKTIRAPGSGSDSDENDGETHDYTEVRPYPFYRKWRLKSTYGVSVEWEPGTSVFVIRGSLTYDHYEAYNVSSPRANEGRWLYGK